MASDAVPASFAEKVMAVLVPAALLAALGAGLTVWRELPAVTEVVSRVERSIDRLELRVTAVEAARYEARAQVARCEQRLDRLEAQK